jgi:type III secretory pathway component EscS
MDMSEKSNIVSNGWATVGRNKRYIVWFYVLNLALAWMGAAAFRQHASALLDHSLYSKGLVQGFDAGVYTEMLARPEFGPMRASSAPSMTFALVFLLVSIVFLPGVFLGYASDHRISREEFFRTCGLNLWRFVRLTILFAIVGGIVAGVLFGIQYGLVKAADTTSYEVLPFYVRLICLAIIFLIMTAIRIWFDLAESDVVIADQGAVRKSVGMAWRQTRQNLGRLLGSYVGISIVSAAILVAGIWLWHTIVPPASVFGAFLISQITLFLVLAMRFWQRATVVAFYTRSRLDQTVVGSLVPAPEVLPAPVTPQPTGI